MEVQELHLPLSAVTNTTTTTTNTTNIIKMIEEESVRAGQFLLDWVGESEHGGPKN